jgi:N-carbamoylputrescine amidase
MAAIVSGCYVLSSNRASSAGSSAPHFGGKGFIYSPTGNLLGMTSAEQPLLTMGINLSLVADAQRRYPCNVREIGMSFSAANRSSRRGTALSAAEDVP